MNNYKLKLKIELGEKSLPISMSLAMDHPETQEDLNEITNYIEEAIRWLNIQKQNELRFFKYRQDNAPIKL